MFSLLLENTKLEPFWVLSYFLKLSFFNVHYFLKPFLFKITCAIIFINTIVYLYAIYYLHSLNQMDTYFESTQTTLASVTWTWTFVIHLHSLPLFSYYFEVNLREHIFKFMNCVSLNCYFLINHSAILVHKEITFKYCEIFSQCWTANLLINAVYLVFYICYFLGQYRKNVHLSCFINVSLMTH